MPAIAKERLEKLRYNLNDRTLALHELMKGRNLKSNREGAGRGHWATPEKMAWVNADDISLAVGDVKSVLAEISKIK